MERVGHDPLCLFRKICVSGPLLHLAFSFPHRSNVFNCARSASARVQIDPAARSIGPQMPWPRPQPVLVAVGRYHGLAAGRTNRPCHRAFLVQRSVGWCRGQLGLGRRMRVAGGQTALLSTGSQEIMLPMPAQPAYNVAPVVSSATSHRLRAR